MGARRDHWVVQVRMSTGASGVRGTARVVSSVVIHRDDHQVQDLASQP